MRFRNTAQEARRLWKEALRSAKFGQCKGAMCRLASPGDQSPASRTYCCLGVAAEVFIDAEPAFALTRHVDVTESDPRVGYRLGHDSLVQFNYGTLPEIVGHWLGFPLKAVHGNQDLPADLEILHPGYCEPDRDNCRDNYTSTLTSMNDSYRLPFDKIATAIEFAEERNYFRVDADKPMNYFIRRADEVVLQFSGHLDYNTVNND